MLKNKIIKILRKYSDFDEDDHKESQEFNSMTGDFEKLINVEVEKRIEARMSDEEIKTIALCYAPIMMYAGLTCMEDVNLSIRQDIMEMLIKLRSRLTNPDNNLKQNSNGSAN